VIDSSVNASLVHLSIVIGHSLR